MSAPRLILPLPGNEAMAHAIAVQCNADLGRIETRRFPDGESYLRLLDDPAGRSVDLVCTLAQPDPQFLRLLFLADAARELGAREVTLLAPYLAYMRQDIRFRPGEAVTSKTFARLLSSSFDRLLTVDPHLHRYPRMDALYTVPAQALHAAPLLADWIGAHVTRPLIIGPDEESEQWASAIAQRIGAPCQVLRKTRHGDRDVEVEVPNLGKWRDHTPVLVDDIASSGRTLRHAAWGLAEQAMRKPECVVVHALFADDAWSELQPLFGRIVSTDAVVHPSNQISLAPLLAEALARNPTH